jgi:hypothetical protein
VRSKLRGRPSARPKAVGRVAGYMPGNEATRSIEERLDDLAVFEELRADLIPFLRKAIESNASPEEILEKGRAAVFARLLSIAVLEPSSNSTLAAIKEYIDRDRGKATDKKEITHRLGKLPDEEVDALLLSKLADNDEE